MVEEAWLLRLANQVWEIRETALEEDIIKVLNRFFQEVLEYVEQKVNWIREDNLVYSTLAFFSQNRRSPRTGEDGWWIDQLPTYIFNNDDIIKSYMLFFSLLDVEFFGKFSLTAFASQGMVNSIPPAIHLVKTKEWGQEVFYTTPISDNPNESSSLDFLNFRIPSNEEVVEAIPSSIKDVDIQPFKDQFFADPKNGGKYRYLKFNLFREFGHYARRKIELTTEMGNFYQCIQDIYENFWKQLHEQFGRSKYVTDWSEEQSKEFARFLLAYHLIEDVKVVYVIPAKMEKRPQNGTVKEFGSGILIFALKHGLPHPAEEREFLKTLWLAINTVYNRLAASDWAKKATIEIIEDLAATASHILKRSTSNLHSIVNITLKRKNISDAERIVTRVYADWVQHDVMNFHSLLTSRLTKQDLKQASFKPFFSLKLSTFLKWNLVRNFIHNSELIQNMIQDYSEFFDRRIIPIIESLMDIQKRESRESLSPFRSCMLFKDETIRDFITSLPHPLYSIQFNLLDDVILKSPDESERIYSYYLRFIFEEPYYNAFSQWRPINGITSLNTRIYKEFCEDSKKKWVVVEVENSFDSRNTPSFLDELKEQWQPPPSPRQTKATGGWGLWGCYRIVRNVLSGDLALRILDDKFCVKICLPMEYFKELK